MAGRAARTDPRRFGHAGAATSGEKHLPRGGLCAGYGKISRANHKPYRCLRIRETKIATPLCIRRSTCV